MSMQAVSCDLLQLRDWRFEGGMGGAGPAPPRSYSIFDQHAAAVSVPRLNDSTGSEKSRSSDAPPGCDQADVSMGKTANRSSKPQWPVRVVQAVENQLTMLFSYEALASPTSDRSQLSEETQRPGEYPTCPQEAADYKAWASEADSGILCRRRGTDAQFYGRPCKAAGAAARDGREERGQAEENKSADCSVHAAWSSCNSQETVDKDQVRDDRLKRKGSPVAPQDLWSELMEGRTYWRSRLNGLEMATRSSGGPEIELRSEPLPCGWEQFLDMKAGKLYYVNWETCERTCQDPRKRMRKEALLEPEEDSSCDTVIQCDDGHMPEGGREMKSVGWEEGCDSTKLTEEQKQKVLSLGKAFKERLWWDGSVDSAAESENETEWREVSEADKAMVAVGCHNCLMFVMLSRGAPKCPNCGAIVLSVKEGRSEQ